MQNFDRRWIWVGLMAMLALAVIWRGEFSNSGEPSWTRCKESLFEQMTSGNCTLRYQGEQRPA